MYHSYFVVCHQPSRPWDTFVPPEKFIRTGHRHGYLLLCFPGMDGPWIPWCLRTRFALASRYSNEILSDLLYLVCVYDLYRIYQERPNKFPFINQSFFLNFRTYFEIRHLLYIFDTHSRSNYILNKPIRTGTAHPLQPIRFVG